MTDATAKPTPTGGVNRAGRLLALPLAFGGRAAAGWGRRLAGANPGAGVGGGAGAQPARVGLLHADPHPGNFLVLTDGRLAMVDYGSVAALPDGLPPALVRILRHVANDEPAPMMELLRAEGIVTGDVTPEDVLTYLGALGDPLRVEHFHFNRAWARRQGAQVVRDPTYWRTGRALTLPPRYLLVVRVLSGWMNILAQIDCTVGVRALARRWLPGFAASSHDGSASA